MALHDALTSKNDFSSCSAASHSRIASRIFSKASAVVAPWEWQPRKAGQLTAYPSSDLIITTWSFMTTT
jgi:hypothetical protein